MIDSMQFIQDLEHLFVDSIVTLDESDTGVSVITIEKSKENNK